MLWGGRLLFPHFSNLRASFRTGTGARHFAGPDAVFHNLPSTAISFEAESGSHYAGQDSKPRHVCYRPERRSNQRKAVFPQTNVRDRAATGSPGDRVRVGTGILARRRRDSRSAAVRVAGIEELGRPAEADTGAAGDDPVGEELFPAATDHREQSPESQKCAACGSMSRLWGSALRHFPREAVPDSRSQAPESICMSFVEWRISFPALPINSRVSLSSGTWSAKQGKTRCRASQPPSVSSPELCPPYRRFNSPCQSHLAVSHPRISSSPHRAPLIRRGGATPPTPLAPLTPLTLSLNTATPAPKPLTNPVSGPSDFFIFRLYPSKAPNPLSFSYLPPYSHTVAGSAFLHSCTARTCEL